MRPLWKTRLSWVEKSVLEGSVFVCEAVKRKGDVSASCARSMNACFVRLFSLCVISTLSPTTSSSVEVS